MDKRAVNTLKLCGLKLKDLYKQGLSPKDVKTLDIKIVVADPEWQKLRSQFVGTWKTNASGNVKLLKAYLDDYTDPFKIRRVLNYLTGSTFRIGIINNQDIEKLRNKVRSVWKRMQAI